MNNNEETNYGETGDEQQGNSLPPSFLAVFYDDRGDVQVGAKDMLLNDLNEWALMLRQAAAKLDLQRHLLVRSEYQKKQNPTGLIVPQG